MKRTSTLLAAAALLLGGCSLKTSYTPNAPVSFADADYELVGEVDEESCNAYILGIDFSGLFVKTSANVPGGSAAPLPIPIPGAGGPKEVGEAMFAAQENMGDATHIVSPRTTTKTTGVVAGPIVLFGQRCATVSGPTAKIKGPYQYAR